MSENSEYYDKVYRRGGFEGVFELPYRRSAYYPLFAQVLAELRRYRVQGILEVGCGTGALAHMIADRTNIRYQGFDFSPVAVEKAATRLGRRDLFRVADALDPASYNGDYDAIVCTEVLEHVDRDYDVIESWRPGTTCVCSVPDFDAEDHVRHFHSEDEVRDRYGKRIRIERVYRVRKPFLTDASWANTVREIWWSRYRPRRVVQILKLGYLQELGSWFVFAGRKIS